jgi:mannose-1-phosphate guanylyltransferase/mannose-6-phosphate isomerase
MAALAAAEPLDRGGAANSTGTTDAARAEAAMVERYLLVLPADHVVMREPAFRAAIAQGLKAAQAGYSTTFGIVPDKAETGYGYIRKGAPSDGAWYHLEQFVEKPDLATAEAYLSSGAYLWNSGMFMFRVDTLLDELERHAPAILAACRRAMSQAERKENLLILGQAFAECPSDSIDYAVMENTERAAVVPLDAGWSDVGSWSSLLEVLPKDAAGNVTRGEVMSLDGSGNLVLAESRTVAVVGLQDIVVVETKEAVLVMAASASQDIKKIVAKLVAGDAFDSVPAGQGGTESPSDSD